MHGGHIWKLFDTQGRSSGTGIDVNQERFSLTWDRVVNSRQIKLYH